MLHTTFGRRSGLRVSELALGTSNFGTGWATGADHAESAKIFSTFAEAGGTFIDTADTYQHGESESYLADFLATDRDHFTVASKFSFGSGTDTDVTATGSSRKTIRRSLEATLSRLKTDYLDIYWAHTHDVTTPLDELLEALDDLVRAGKILYAGLSNFSAWQAAAIVSRGDALGRSPVSAIQFEYSLVVRDGDRELLPMAEELGLGVALYSPLGGGLLTGKYRKSAEGRLSTLKSVIQREDTAQKTAVVDALLAIASDSGFAPAEIAIAYLLERGRRSRTSLIPIVGPRSIEQLETYLRALEITLPDGVYDRLTIVSAPELGIPHTTQLDMNARVLGGDPGAFVTADGRPIDAPAAPVPA